MRKIFTIILLTFFTSAYAAGHMSSKDKEATLACAGLYYANSMIPQGELELEKIVHSFAAKKFLNSYLIQEGVKEEKLNEELLKIVDVRYGKPYEEKTTNECDKFIYNLISDSKDEIKKIAESGIY